MLTFGISILLPEAHAEPLPEPTASIVVRDTPPRIGLEQQSTSDHQPESDAVVAAKPEIAKKELKLVRLSRFQASGRIAKVAGLAAWALMVCAWASLIWLPALAIHVGLRLRRDGAQPGLVGAAAGLLALYSSPFVSPEWSPGTDGPSFLLRGWLNWFKSVELWAVEGVLPRKPGAPPVLYCYHPHGVFTVGSIALSSHGKELFPDGVVVLGSEYINYFGPLLTQLLRQNVPAQFRFNGVSRSSFHRVLKEQQSAVVMVPGGIQEATLTCSGHERLFLQERKGFVKYALQYGYALSPVYAFGETDAFHNVQGGLGWRLSLNKGFFGGTQGLPTVLPYGWRWFPLVPEPETELRVVIGRPLQLPCIPNPSNFDVEHWHAVYMNEVQEVYTAGVKQTGAPSRLLEVF